MTDQITRKAYAKINLGLDVTGRRSDGYHEVKMVMQTVGIYDVLTFRKSEKKDTPITVFIDNEELPCGRENLIYKAAELLMQTYPVEEGVEITLSKNIPIAAGMAGGSTDAAAVFHGMNELFDLGMTLETMKGLGVKIGADVPFCIQGGTALSQGIGEILTPLSSPPFAHLAVAKPDISVSTRFVYENLHVETLRQHPDIDKMVEAIEAGNLEGITERMENVLETVTERKYPVIGELKRIMLEKGAMNALMSGSGPAVFGIYRTREEAENACEAIKESKMAKQLFVTEFV